MSLLSDLFGGNIGGLVSDLFGGGGGSGNSNSNTSALSNFLAGQVGTQRIPGQTQPGSYTPDPGGFGTYNYIPTGAGQIDPALISLLQSNMGQTGGATGFNPAQMSGSDAGSFAALQNILNNPATAGYTGAAGAAGAAAGAAGTQAGDISSLLAANGNDMLGMIKSAMQGIQSNPYTQNAVNGAGQVGTTMGDVGQNITGFGSGTMQYGTQLNQLYNQISQQALNNPYNAQAMQGAQTAGNMLQGAGVNGAGQGGMLGNTAMQGLPAAMQMLQTAFDPQTALYNKTATQNQDQIGAMLARTGLTGSGAGAGLASDATSNFNLNWQNQQLGREQQGLNSFTNAVSGAGQNFAAGNALQSAGAGQVAQGAGLPGQTYNAQQGQNLGVLGQLGGGYSTGAGLGQTAASLYGQGTGLQAQGNTYGANTFNTLYQPTIDALKGLSGATSNITNMYGAATDQGAAGANLTQNAGALPYNAYNTVGGNQLGGINSFQNNAAQGSGLNNTNVTQLLNYLSSVSRGSQIAGSNAQGAQGQQTSQNAGAVAGLSPLINGGLSSLYSLLSGSGGGSSVFNNPSLFQDF